MSSENSAAPVINYDTATWKIPGGVQLFFVQNDNEIVAVLEAPTKLEIILQTGQNQGVDEPDCYVRVASWVYELYKGKSQVRKCVNELYVFPFPQHVTPSNYQAFGIVISDDLSPSYKQNFERLLDKYAVFTIEASPPSHEIINLSKTVRYPEICGDESSQYDNSGGAIISRKIDQGADLVCHGLVKSADMAAFLIQFSSNALKKSIKPSNEPARVSKNLEKTAEIAKNLSGYGVRATGMLVTGVTKITNAATTKLSPYVKSAALSATSSVSSNSTEENTKAVHNIALVARSGVRGFSKVWTGFEEASMAVAKAAADATVDTVNHSYGPDAAHVASDATGAALNFGTCVNNVKQVGMKVLAKRVAKDAGKEFLENYAEKTAPSSTPL